MAPHDPFIVGDALMLHGVRGVLGYHGNELGRYQALYGINDGYQSVANPNFWALTNAQYFYTNANTVPFPGAKLVAGPVRNAAGTMTYLFELPGSNPVAWIAPLIVALGDGPAQSTILNPNFDVRRVAIFDSAAPVHAKPLDSPIPILSSTHVRATRYDPGAIDLVVEGQVSAGSALIVSENYFPGWSATVDGRPFATARADFALIGIELPADAHTVSLRFDSPSYRLGQRISLTALAVATLMLVGGTLTDRRRTAAAAA
jgi:hypothetical protein